MFKRYPHSRFALFILAAAFLGPAVVADNLLVNSDGAKLIREYYSLTEQS